MNKKLIIFLVAVILFAISSIAHAEWYWGADKIDSPSWYQLDDDLSTYNSRNEQGVKFYSGYKASDFFTLELEYKDQMEFGVGDVFSGQELWYEDGSQDIDSKALFLSGQSTYNFDGGHYVYLRGGLYNWEVESNDLDLNDVNNLNGTGTDLFYSIGSYFDLTDTISVSTAWERFEYENDNVDFISTELRFNF